MGVSDRRQESVGRRKTEECHGERSAAIQGNVLDHFALLVMTRSDARARRKMQEIVISYVIVNS